MAGKSNISFRKTLRRKGWSRIIHANRESMNLLLFLCKFSLRAMDFLGSIFIQVEAYTVRLTSALKPVAMISNQVYDGVRVGMSA